MKKFIFAIVLLPGIIFSQTIPLNDVDFYLELINTIESYEKYSSLRKKSYYDKYDNLFNDNFKS